jgi:uncharacterized membrane protein (DUF4010 family)
MNEADIMLRIGSALVIGLLVGLQREYALGERKEKLFGGVRTFPLLALAGCLGALLNDMTDSPWPLLAVLLSLGGLLMIAYHANTRLGRLGLTTETAAILTILAGVLSYWELYALAAATGVITTLLLSLKVELHGFVQRMTREDLFATLKFAVITAVVLPVLPNRNYGPPPLNVLNPSSIWLMVVFISGISFMGYVLIKAIGPRRGIGLSGLLGGLVSSTAVTLSLTQRSREQQHLIRPLALAIVASWTVMYVRVLVVVAALNAQLVTVLWMPMLASALVGLLYGGYLLTRQRTDEVAGFDLPNPFELKPALQFGALYAVILVVSRAAQVYLGDTGVYLSSAAAGLADLNAISLSMAQLSEPVGVVSQGVAARALVLAVVANTLVKGGMVLTLGARDLRRALWPGLALMIVTGAVVAFLVT